MTQNVWFIAAIWMALALSASLISIWAGISVVLVEILVGVIAGNFLGIHATTDWINFLALLGSGVLTFLAGAEIDPRSLKANLRASGLIGLLSFGAPFVSVWLFAQIIGALGICDGTEKSGEQKARHAHLRQVTFRAFAGRRHVCRYAGAWLTRGRWRRGNDCISAAV
jgi:hypothetical protein